MTPITNGTAITANGEYSFPQLDLTGGSAILEWGISSGSATVTPGWIDPAGNFQKFVQADGSDFTFAASGGGLEVGVPCSRLLALKVESAASLSMKGAANLTPLRP